MKPRILGCAMAAVALTSIASCNSFNQFVTLPTNNITAVTLTAAHTEEIVRQWHRRPPAKDTLCPAYVPPILPPTPALPIKELERISPDDGEALDRLQRHHIKELRAYIVRLKLTVEASQADYIRHCQQYLQK